MKCVPVDKQVADAFVSQKHYSRKPSIFWAGFGLIIDNKIEGVCVFGQPSPPLQKHAFKDRDFRFYELSRLVIQTDVRNAASFLVGNALRMLDSPCAVVSYADTAYGHSGIVYQATNWLYTGATKSHDSLYLVEGEKLHPMTIRDRYEVTNPSEWAKDNGFEKIPPALKHRYFYLCGTKRERRGMLASLQYEVRSDYPKSPKTTYDAGPRIDMLFEPEIPILSFLQES